MNRSVSIDLLKMISIFGVVVIHANGITVQSGLFEVIISNLSRVAVPCFIVIWSFFTERAYNKNNDFLKYQIKRLISFFRVYLIWSLIYFFISVDLTTLTFQTLITKYFSGYGFAGQYFFIILFQLVVLFPLIRFLLFKRVLFFISCAILAGCYFYWNYRFVELPNIIKALGIRPFVFWIPYVFLGIYLNHYKRSKVIKHLVIPTIILLILELFVVRLNHIMHLPYLTFGVLLSSIIICVYFFEYQLTSSLSTLRKFLHFVGRNTMTVFVFNPMVVVFLEKIIRFRIEHCIVLYDIALYFFVFFSCLCFAYVLEKTRLNKILV